MECLCAIGTSIAGKVAEYIVEPVGRQLGYIIFYRQNVDNLKAETEDINLKKETLENLVVAAKDSGDKIHAEIEDCLTKVDDISKAAQQLLDSTNIKCSFGGSISYLAARYRTGKRAKKMNESVVEIKGKIRLDNISFRPRLQNIVIGNKGYLTSASREKLVEQVLEALGEHSLRTIGIHGMPGTGKTTLVKEIARKALQKDRMLFDDAVIITVSQIPNLGNIQQQIAERLGLKFDKQGLSERAIELQNRLKDEKRFLVVLDDIWCKLELKDVGVDFQSDQKGCKVLMTSRFEKVLCNDMEVDKSFKVEILSEDEARNWFESIVGDAVSGRGFKECGNKIIEKCGCLPLCIVTVANSLKNCDKLPLWRTALRQLQRSEHGEVRGVVHTAIKLCYDNLQSDEAKKLLLLCSLHDEDANIKVENLMRYCLGQISMLKSCYTLQEARELMYSLVEELKDHCLLLDGDDFVTVKMHDLVRDFAISFMKESQNMRCFRDGNEVKEFLKEKKFEDLEAISLPNGYLDELVFESSEYTKLQLVICMWRESSKMIPAEFLDRTKALRVLDFSSQFFDPEKVLLASHLSSLQSLHTLCLRNSDVEDIAEIGKLKNLEILDLSLSKITELPSEIGQLTSLRMLDLSECSWLEKIDPNVILHLKNLEELYVDQFKNWHKVGADKKVRRNAGLDDLKHLVRLTALHVYVPDVKMLPEDLLGQQLEQYDIKIGDYRYGFAESSVSKCLLIKHPESSLLQLHGLELLMKRSEQLWLEGFNGLHNIVGELDMDGFKELKILRLVSNETVQYLVNSMGQIHPCTAFCSLEKLFLEDMRNLKQICHGEDAAELFKSKALRVITIINCNSLENLLPLSNSTQLEEIEISNCNSMEEIFNHEIQGSKSELLQLRSLKLVDVPKLSEFCSFKKIYFAQKEEEPFLGDSATMPMFNGKFLCFPKLENLELRGCDVEKLWDDQLLPSPSTSFCWLTNLVVAKCKFLKSVASSSMATSFKQLCSLEVTGCEALEEIVSRDGRTDKISFPKLYSLKLNDLPKLYTFSSVIFIKFPKLNHLYINKCPQLKTFVSKSSEEESNTTIPSLFDNSACFPKLENFELWGCDLKKIWDDQLLQSSNSFRSLTKLVVMKCQFLKYLFSSAMALHFEQLRSVEVKECETMEQIMIKLDERMDCISFPKLQILIFDSHPKMVSFSSEISIEFPMLMELYMYNCSEFKTFVSKSAEASSLFDERVSFPSLKIAHIINMDQLKMIWHFELCDNITSFCRLEEVQVEWCNNLRKIFPSAMHTTLHNLKSLQIAECEMLEEIFEIQTSSSTEIVPTQLNSLILENLPNLKYVWSKDPLVNVSIRECGIEEIMNKEEGLERNPSHHFSFPQLENLLLNDLPRLVSIHERPHTSTFPLLKWLTVDGCREVKVLFSWEVFKFQRKHGSVKCDIPIQQPLFFIAADHKTAFPNLTSISVCNMDGLKMIWQYGHCTNPDWFCKLERVEVRNCNNLMGIFPFSMHRSLGNLTSLHIRECEMVEEIFEIQTSNSVEIILDKLNYLRLHHLPNLKYLWSKDAQGTFAFPNLMSLKAVKCPNMKADFLPAKGLPLLSDLCIKKCGIEEIFGSKLERPDDAELVFPQLLIMELKSLPNLVSFYAGTKTVRFPSLKNLEVKNCWKVKALNLRGRREALFSTKVTFGTDLEFKIKLCELPNMMHLVEEQEEEEEDSSQKQPQKLVFPYLTDLQVVRCQGLKKLAPPSFSFQNLNSLIVRGCNGMLHLLSYQTAKSMTRLSELMISKCKRVEEIVTDGGVDSKCGEVVFTELECLVLDDLPRLTSFYSGNCSMEFPALEHLVVNRCFEMENFSKHGFISTPKLKKIRIKDVDSENIESEPEPEPEPEPESGLESEAELEPEQDLSMVDVNTIIKNHWMTNLPGSASKELSTENDMAPSNWSEE